MQFTGATEVNHRLSPKDNTLASLLLPAAIALFLVLSIENIHGPIIPYRTPLQILSIFTAFFLTPLLNKYAIITKRSLRVLVLLLIFFCLALMSSLWSNYPTQVIQRSFLFLIPMIGFFLATSVDTQPQKSFLNFCWMMVGAGSFFSVVGVLTYILGHVTPSPAGPAHVLSVGPFAIAQQLYGTPPLIRVSALLGNPNSFASLLMVTILVTVGLVVTDPARRRELILATGLQILALLLTFSRTGIISTITGGAILYLLIRSTQGRPVSVKLIGLTGLMSLIAVVGGATVLDGQRFSVSLTGRNEIWQVLLESIHQNPLLGVGFGVSTNAILSVQGISQHAHNAYLAVWAELGIVGLFVFLLIWLSAFREGLLAFRKQNGSEQLFIAIALSSIVAFAVHGLAELTVLQFYFRQMIWSYLIAYLCHPLIAQ